MITIRILEAQEMIPDEQCENSHTNLLVCKMIVWISTNIILKNLCLKKNDILSKNKNKRKMETQEF